MPTQIHAQELALTLQRPEMQQIARKALGLRATIEAIAAALASAAATTSSASNISDAALCEELAGGLSVMSALDHSRSDEAWLFDAKILLLAMKDEDWKAKVSDSPAAPDMVGLTSTAHIFAR